MIRPHGPILRTAVSASIGFAATVALGSDRLPHPVSGVYALWFVAGVLYAQLLEYSVHRFVMHRSVSRPGTIRLNHIVHHRTFRGDNFRNRNSAELATIPGRWWIFPAFCVGHYIVLVLVFPPGATTVFLFACLLQYIGFEVTHWFTHLKDNAVDRTFARVPLIRTVWAQQIEHHRTHHRTPNRAFNFSFPYIGDLIADRLGRPNRNNPYSPDDATAVRTRM